jgi:hypothetical protein
MSCIESAAIVDFAEAASRLRTGWSRSPRGPVNDCTAPAKRRSRRLKPQEPGADYIEQILRFRCALVNLAANNSDPAEIIRYMDPLFGDVPVIRAHLDHAVRWINRFAEEWDHEQKTHGSPGEVRQSSE